MNKYKMKLKADIYQEKHQTQRNWQQVFNSTPVMERPAPYQQDTDWSQEVERLQASKSSSEAEAVTKLAIVLEQKLKFEVKAEEIKEMLENHPELNKEFEAIFAVL